MNKFWAFIVVALMLCNIGFAQLCVQWRESYAELIQANQNLLVASEIQAEEGDQLMRMIGDMAEHGFCLAPSKPPSRFTRRGDELDV